MSYISILADYAVAQPTPSNGKTAIQDVTPSEWITSDPGVVKLSAVISAYGGGPKAVSGTKLFVHNSGHTDSANNGMYIEDASGSSAPVGWLTPVISAVADVRTNAVYADGRPSGVHTYDGQVYAHHNGFIYRFTGSIYVSGNQTSQSWKYEVATGIWTQLTNHPGVGPLLQVSTLYDAVSGKILVGICGASVCYFFNTATDTWSSAKSISVSWPGDTCGAYDSSRSRGIFPGGGTSFFLATVNWSAETVTTSSPTFTGSTALAIAGLGLSCVYHPIRDVYWMWGGRDTGASGGSALGYQNIYEINASTWAITAHTLTGVSIPSNYGAQGTYGRYLFMPSEGAIITAFSASAGSFVIKVPGTGTVTAPTDDRIRHGARLVHQRSTY